MPTTHHIFAFLLSGVGVILAFWAFSYYSPMLSTIPPIAGSGGFNVTGPITRTN